LVTPSSSSAAAQDSAPRYVVLGTGGSGVELRGGPGGDQPSLGSLPEGTIVEIVDDRLRDWYAVRAPRSFELPVAYCSAAFLTALLSEATMPEARVLRATVTAYANGADGGVVGSRTASGTTTHWGTVAADVRLFPIGTRLLIDGFGEDVFVVEDTGSGMRGLIFDVWFPELSEAQAFGTQRRKVTVLP
jgi:3D (Asp-Asp-Asp) domain-containing protein